MWSKKVLKKRGFNFLMIAFLIEKLCGRKFNLRKFSCVWNYFSNAGIFGAASKKGIFYLFWKVGWTIELLHIMCTLKKNGFFYFFCKCISSFLLFYSQFLRNALCVPILHLIPIFSIFFFIVLSYCNWVYLYINYITITLA